MLRVNLEPAYVLHRRPYRDTSFIAELFTANYGRVSVVARSARGLQSRYKGKLELFSPLLVSWAGRHELKSLGNIELQGMPLLFSGNTLLCGFYMNELLIRLLQRDDPYPNLFRFYQEALQKMTVRDQLQMTLRCFEKNLLQELGYGLSFLHIQPENYYQYVPENGFRLCHQDQSREDIFSGHSLLALREERCEDATWLPEAKRLMRLVLERHLGNKPIKSRELLR